MKIRFKKYINKVLTLIILSSNLTTFSNAGELSPDNRYETFKGNNFKITDILEEQLIDVEVKGNTLVNLFGIQGTKTINISNNGVRYRDFNDVYLKPNKTYTVYVNIANLSTNLTSKLKICYKVKNDSGELVDAYPAVHYTKENVREGLMAITFATDSRHSEGLFKIYVDTMGSTSGGIATPFSFNMNECILLEGDWSNKELPKYFEGLKSVGENNNGNASIDLISENKNLFKNELYPRSNNTITEIRDNGDVRVYNTSNGTWGFQYFTFNAKPNTTYTFSVGDIEVISGAANINIYEARNGELYGDVKYGSLTKPGKVTFTTSDYIGKDNIKVVFSLYSTLDTSTQGEVIYKNVQIEESNTQSYYFKYSNNVANISLKEPLRALPNGVHDKIIKKNGQWFIERNCKETTLTENSIKRVTSGAYNEVNINRIEFNIDFFEGIKVENWVSTKPPEAIFEAVSWMKYEDSVANFWTWFHSVQGTFHIVVPNTITPEEAKNKVLGTKVVYQLKNPIYEPVKVEPSLDLYENTTYISNDSLIPTVLTVIVDRTLNRATEAIELAKENPTIENISLARMWTNLLKESTLKDDLQNDINEISATSDLEIEKKTATANLDLYVKSNNSLTISLSTNSITFESYSGVEDLEMLDAVNITINSSLPYSLNAYMPVPISNADGSNTIDTNILNIRDNTESNYNQFINTTDKIVLKDDCTAGNNNIHNIDFKLSGNNLHKADVYKTVIKFEAEQK